MTTSVLDEIYHNILYFIQRNGWRIVFALLILYGFYHWLYLPYLYEKIQNIGEEGRRTVLDQQKKRIRLNQQAKVL